MLHHTQRNWTFLIAAFLLFTSSIHADDEAAGALKNCEDVSYALTLLQNHHRKDSTTFVLQKELDPLIHHGGGGACASAAGIDVLQVLRVMAGLDRLSNPHKVVLSSFDDQPELLKGRVTNDQFVKLIRFYAEHHLNKTKLDIQVVSAPNSPYKMDQKTWSAERGPEISAIPRSVRVLSYTVFDPEGSVIGRHFVLLKAHSKNQVQVVDPMNPVSDRTYVLENRSGEKGQHARLLLQNPSGVRRSRDLVYSLNTVFTVSLRTRTANEDQQPSRATSVDEIKRKIDETVVELRGTQDFLDPRAWRKRTAAFGLPALDLPVEHGGSNWPASKMIEVFKHAGEYNLNFRDVVGGAHVRPLLVSKKPEVADIVRKVADGSAYIAISITEPGAGSDVAAMTSTARKTDRGYRLSGEKRFNARLEQASHVIIFTRAATGEEGKLSAFVLPLDTPGLTVTRLRAHGLTGNSYGGLVFKDLFVPEHLLIGDDGQGGKLFFRHFMYWRLMQAAAAIGTGEDALRQMADRIKSRHAFGGPIGRFTHLQQQIGQHATELRMAFALTREAAELLDRDEYSAAQPLISGVKAEGVEAAIKAVDVAMRAFGAEGYSHEVDLGDRLRDLLGLRIADGTTDVMRMDVVRRTFGDEFWEMAVQPRKQD